MLEYNATVPIGTSVCKNRKALDVVCALVQEAWEHDFNKQETALSALHRMLSSAFCFKEIAKRRDVMAAVARMVASTNPAISYLACVVYRQAIVSPEDLGSKAAQNEVKNKEVSVETGVWLCLESPIILVVWDARTE